MRALPLRGRLAAGWRRNRRLAERGRCRSRHKRCRLRVRAPDSPRRPTAWLRRGPFVTRPAEIGSCSRSDIEAIDLFSLVPADVADPDLARAGTQREAERIPQAVRDDAPRVHVGRTEQRIVGEPEA